MWTIRLLTRASNKNIAISCSQQQQQQQQQQLTRLQRWTGSSCNALAYQNNKNFTFHNADERNWHKSIVDKTLLLNSQKCHFSTNCCPKQAGKSDSKSAAVAEADIFGEASKLGLFAKFKLMYKKYWYVLLPVHIVTSLGWFAGFYYMSKSGVDIVTLLQYMRLSDALIAKVQHSDMGHVAIAYLCYKVATPVRYALTLGGTTLTIKHLVQVGCIKPMPSKDEFLRMYEEQKATRAACKAEKNETEKRRNDDK